jgi:hypothetical protein
MYPSSLAVLLARLQAVRPLSVQERHLAQSVFAEHLSLDSIRICASGWIWRGYAMSPNGHVYFHPDDYCIDFAQQSLSRQAWLMHELTHVWQVQQGIKVVRQAIFDRRYDYVLESGRAFLSYGVEQQAQMVQDYFLRRACGQSCDALACCLPFLK